MIAPSEGFLSWEEGAGGGGVCVFDSGMEDVRRELRGGAGGRDGERRGERAGVRPHGYVLIFSGENGHGANTNAGDVFDGIRFG